MWRDPSWRRCSCSFGTITNARQELAVELVIMVIVAFPLGFFIRSLMAAYLAYIAVHSFVFSFQNMELVREWTGGDYSAFPKDPSSAPWSYGLVNLLIYGVGLGLVALGYTVRARRRKATVVATSSQVTTS
jgi:hypothetical protein